MEALVNNREFPPRQAEGHVADAQKLAFLVHEPTLWAHYSNVWAKLDPDSFAIVLTNRFRPPQGRRPDLGVGEFLARVQAAGYETAWADETIRNGIRYSHVVSNHKMRGDSAQPAPARVQATYALDHAIKHGINRICTALGRPERFGFHGFAPKQYWPLQIGDVQIRFMYGADVGEGWSLAPWNAIYHAFLCHGPNDAQQLAKRFRGRTFQMGYPRYDGYYAPDLDTSAEAREFSIDPSRRTLLWMPTFGKGACSIPHFAQALAPLRAGHNFIVRPHPLSFRKSPDEIALLRSLGFRLDDQPARDMNKLLKLADVMLCDYGGSAFGAVYLRKRMVLLEVPGARDWYTVRNASNLELTGHYPVIGPERAGELGALLEDEPYWQAQQARAAPLADKYFADFRGTSADEAARILSNIRTLLAHPERGEISA
ncbi:MAG TPA: CDP-glycerol glycerophosphotransferase family protein [Rhodanobacteraceae bacterium]|nr:CDP-glycerol glycerophosphotransferase family protein [Rhodanobacteraceae bacterium]